MSLGTEKREAQKKGMAFSGRGGSCVEVGGSRGRRDSMFQEAKAKQLGWYCGAERQDESGAGEQPGAVGLLWAVLLLLI